MNSMVCVILASMANDGAENEKTIVTKFTLGGLRLGLLDCMYPSPKTIIPSGLGQYPTRRMVIIQNLLHEWRNDPKPAHTTSNITASSTENGRSNVQGPRI